ncbi:hypothetical protein HMPREF1624_06686 [Sporothrix schenckii ATCC 58251]|uniref:Uncharacterized protein n=2 Tax=Sporothrix schenckii TaxID=29908 RepID=U7PRI5_SPOS1|nr:hypothetical protein HMPREF1624_06686 [Sporothrix schenckii ATCC 58251]
MAVFMGLLLDNGKASMDLRDCAALTGTTISIEQKPLVHHWVLAGWSVPINEMFDLEALRAQRVVHDRWTFFFASVPLRVPGGVASPTNGRVVF